MLRLLRYPAVVSNMRRLAASAMSKDVLAAFVDFDYQHYALGDMLTKQVSLGCQAIEKNCRAIDLFALVDPARPSAPTQGFVAPENYIHHLSNLMPAFLCTPMLRAVHVLRDGGLSASYYRMAAKWSRVPIWPSYSSQVRREMTYPLGHHEINAFHAKHDYIPKLQIPKGYETWVNAFIEKHLANKFVVCINPRQSRLTPSPAVIYRDADLGVWHEFITSAKKEFDDVVFLQLGSYSEWSRSLLDLENVVVPRAWGLNLAHELALLCSSNMFLGTSSGFATMATFSDIPYLICDIEHFFAPFSGVNAYDESYPFADPGQVLLWEKEAPDLLLAHLERVYEPWARRKRPKRSQRPTPPAAVSNRS